MLSPVKRNETKLYKKVIMVYLPINKEKENNEIFYPDMARNWPTRKEFKFLYRSHKEAMI